ncbi:SpoU rRNA Methylase family, partial [Thraustotheca clavata]
KFIGFSCAVVQQCIDVLNEEDPKIVSGMLERVVNTICLPLLTNESMTRNVMQQAIQLTLYVLELPMLTESITWIRQLENSLIDMFSSSDFMNVSWMGHVVEVLFQRKLVSKIFVEKLLNVCKTILCQPDYSHFRQAVFGSIVPQLLLYNGAQNAELLALHVFSAYEQMQLQDVLLLLCELIPQAPKLSNTDIFQTIVRKGMNQNDMMVRKMALHLLQASLTFEPNVHDSWTEFIQAFEVVHFHQEQHLLEQVWPRITSLLQLTLTTKSFKSSHIYAESMGFEWFKCVLSRCWQHENPVIRRMTLVDSMKACSDLWKDETTQERLANAAIHFITHDLLMALNDPFLFKHEKYQVKTTTVQFLTKFLKIVTLHKQLSAFDFLQAVQSAIFGDEVRGNSPDALLAMLTVFQDICTIEMNNETWSILRYMIQAHVLQSFPHSMKILVPLLEHILLTLTPLKSLSLEVLVRILALFPQAHLAEKRLIFGTYIKPLQLEISSAISDYIHNPASSWTPQHLARLYFLCTVSVPWKKDGRWIEQCQLFQAINELDDVDGFTKEFMFAFAPTLAIVKDWLRPGALVDDDLDCQKHIVLVVAILANYRMVQEGNCDYAFELNGILESNLKFDLPPQQRALVLVFLQTISEKTMLMDSIQVFDPISIVPTLLNLRMTRNSKDGDAKQFTSYNQAFVFAKFTTLANVLRTCWSLGRSVLNTILDTALDSLSTAGSDPSILQAMVRVLSIVLPYTIATISDEEERDLKIDLIFSQVWAAYLDSRKPDGLTYTVIQCLFQPRLMTLPQSSVVLKEWFHKWATWAETGKRPNVMYHLATTLCSVWRHYPKSAIAYLDELVRLLLYKEPSVDEKERMIYLADNTPLKSRFVRFVTLAFLEDAPVECQSVMDALIIKLLTLQQTPEYQKPQMINSDGFGKQLRSWQALCILSRYLREEKIQQVHVMLWQKAFLNHNLPQIRYYIEIFSMRVTLLFPTSSFPYIHDLLKNVHLMPQLSASILLVTGTVLRWLPVEDSPTLHLKTLHLMAPWLNSAHGHTRTIVQFVMTTLLPYFLAHESFHDEVVFLEPTLRFLSTNKECKRMFRRQTQQIASFIPQTECCLEGLLDHPLNEFDEIVPMSILCQIKDTLSAAYAQFLKEDQQHGCQYQTNVADRLAPRKVEEVIDIIKPESTDTVQRKIDPHTTSFLEDMLAAYESENMRDKQTNARRARRQSVIVCASLVDKMPNVAGLARTCEIFNASKLLIPNMAMTDDVIFRQISVTADKWVPMEEVKPNMVRSYCRRMQLEGYTIIALEQTSSSESLTTYNFPDKCLIILGNEKEGIPVDILQAVDQCVEIPQLGVIRSLNVHVSGAILLWGYTQQQLRR